MNSNTSVFNKQFKKVRRMPGGAYGKIYLCEVVGESRRNVVVKKFKQLDV
jgi:hypothetical protein